MDFRKMLDQSLSSQFFSFMHVDVRFKCKKIDFIF